MHRVLILYGTTDGQTAKIASALSETLSRGGCVVGVVEALGDRRVTSPVGYDAVIVAASVQAGRYQTPVRRWVREHRDMLAGLPTAFVSVCLGVLERKPEVDLRLQRIIYQFLAESGWTPGEAHIVAGALPYTRYGWLKKRLMRRIARRAGGDTDITRDFEYTDWDDLRKFAAGFARRHGLVSSPAAEPAGILLQSR